MASASQYPTGPFDKLRALGFFWALDLSGCTQTARPINNSS